MWGIRDVECWRGNWVKSYKEEEKVKPHRCRFMVACLATEIILSSSPGEVRPSCLLPRARYSWEQDADWFRQSPHLDPDPLPTWVTLSLSSLRQCPALPASCIPLSCLPVDPFFPMSISLFPVYLPVWAQMSFCTWNNISEAHFLKLPFSHPHTQKWESEEMLSKCWGITYTYLPVLGLPLVSHISSVASCFIPILLLSGNIKDLAP